MPEHRGLPLSDDDFSEQLKEANARVEFALAGLTGTLARLALEGALTNTIISEMATTFRDMVTRLEARLTPEQRESYDALRAAGVLPLDALAAIESGDEEGQIVALMEVDDDEDETE